MALNCDCATVNHHSSPPFLLVYTRPPLALFCHQTLPPSCLQSSSLSMGAMTAALDSISLDDNPSAARSRNRAPSLSTACPPAGVVRPPTTTSSSGSRVGADPFHNASQLCKRLFRLRITRLLAWGYLAISMVVFTLHLPSLTSKYNHQHSASSSTPGLKTTTLRKMWGRICVQMHWC